MEFPLYAVTLRAVRSGKKVRMQGWPEELEVNNPLPALPLWLTADVAVPLELEETYQATCVSLGLPAIP